MIEGHGRFIFLGEICGAFLTVQNAKTKRKGRVIKGFSQKWLIFYIFIPVILFFL